jgi:hypothetical protein
MKFLCKFPTFDVFHMTEEMFSSFVDKQERTVYKVACLHGFTLEFIHFHLGYTPHRAVGGQRRFGETCFLHLKG